MEGYSDGSDSDGGIHINFDTQNSISASDYHLNNGEINGSLNNSRGLSHSNSLRHILASITMEREKERLSYDLEKGIRLSNILHSQFWTQLFNKNFLSVGSSLVDGSKDDMLFYVRKVVDSSKIRVTTSIEVFRKNNQNLPRFDDQSIDWEETVFLNLIMQHFEYTVTCAVCSRTGAKELQILRKFSQKVYASPSRHRMDGKAAREEITYPNIFFTVDNFEECFSECHVRDSELICVELSAHDRFGKLQGVIFLGSIRYEALRQVYDNRLSLTSRFSMRSSSRSTKSHTDGNNRRMEFMRMRGPHGKGHAEMAVARAHTEPGTPAEEELNIRNGFGGSTESGLERRLADNNERSSWRFMWRGGGSGLRKSRSDSANIDSLGDITEVEARNVEEEFVEESCGGGNGPMGEAATVASSPAAGLNSARSFGQAWHWFKERRRASSVALNACLTYVTLPWHRIIADVLEIRQQPILTFDDIT